MYYMRSNAGNPQGPVGGGSAIFITSTEGLKQTGEFGLTGLKCIGCERGEMGCLGWEPAGPEVSELSQKDGQSPTGSGSQGGVGLYDML